MNWFITADSTRTQPTWASAALWTSSMMSSEVVVWAILSRWSKAASVMISAVVQIKRDVDRHLEQPDDPLYSAEAEQLTTKSSVQRLAEFLLRLSPEATGSIEINLPVDKSLIAGRLGMQPETLSLSTLRTVGVETRKEHIFIEDVDTLRRITED